jgi:hypothetical protein
MPGVRQRNMLGPALAQTVRMRLHRKNWVRHELGPFVSARPVSYVKGTVLLVLRKRHGTHKTTRDDLAWEIQEEVEAQVQALTGLNQAAKGLYRDENVFEDADIQMAGT